MKNRVIITLGVSAMLNDIYRKSAKYASILKYNAQDTDAGERMSEDAKISESDSAFVKRAMTGALGHVRAACVREHAVWQHKHTADDKMMAGDDVVVTLHLPELYDLAGNETLAQAMHDYIVAKTLKDWYGVTAPAKVAEAAQEAVEAMQLINATLRARVRRMKAGTVVEVGISPECIYAGTTTGTTLTATQAAGFSKTEKDTITVTAAANSYIWFCSVHDITVTSSTIGVPLTKQDAQVTIDSVKYYAYRVSNIITVAGSYEFNIIKQ